MKSKVTLCVGEAGRRFALTLLKMRGAQWVFVVKAGVDRGKLWGEKQSCRATTQSKRASPESNETLPRYKTTGPTVKGVRSDSVLRTLTLCLTQHNESVQGGAVG